LTCSIITRLVRAGEELLVQALGFGGGTVLHDADGGEVREHRATMMSARPWGSA